MSAIDYIFKCVDVALTVAVVAWQWTGLGCRGVARSDTASMAILLVGWLTQGVIAKACRAHSRVGRMSRSMGRARGAVGLERVREARP
jgi:hypothetical protein